jgi:hypothetical protein
VADLTPERMARLRVWAERFSPEHPDWREPGDRHAYNGACPWCRADDRPSAYENPEEQ